MHFTKGYSYLWILIIVIIGAFFLSGGQFIFEDLNKLGVPSPTPTPFNNSNGGSTAPSNWALTAQINCTGQNGQTRVIFVVQAVTYPAYLIVQIKNDQDQYVTDPVFNTTINNVSENGPTKTFNSAYSTRQWQAILYEGNSADASKQKAILANQPATKCP